MSRDLRDQLFHLREVRLFAAVSEINVRGPLTLDRCPRGHGLWFDAEELEQLLASPDLYRDGEKVKATTRAFEETKAELQQLYEHWEEAVELN